MADDAAPPFGRWLRQRMDESRPPIDAAELARRCGANSSTVGRWLRGETRPSPDTLKLLPPVLGVDYGDLLVLAGYGRPSDTLTAMIEPRALSHRLAVEIDQMLADDSPLPADRRMRLEVLLDAVVDPDRKAMRRRRRTA